MHESRHTHIGVTAHSNSLCTRIQTNICVMTHICAKRSTHIKESWHTGAHMNESWHTHKGVTARRCTYEGVMAHTCNESWHASAHANESWHTHNWVTAHRCTCAWVMAHTHTHTHTHTHETSHGTQVRIWMTDGTHMIDSWHTDAHMHESWHTHKTSHGTQVRMWICHGTCPSCINVQILTNAYKYIQMMLNHICPAICLYKQHMCKYIQHV